MADHYTTILAAVEGVLGDVATLSGDTIERRERLHYDPERDTLPLTLIVPDKEDPRLHLFDGGLFSTYPVIVARLTAGNYLIADAASHAAMREAREDIRQALFVTTLADAPAVYDCDYDPDPVVSTEGLDRALRVSAQRFTYSALVDRN